MLVEDARAVGVETETGEMIHAKAVVAGINPKLLYLDLIDPLALPEAFRRRMENFRCGSGVFRMNVALSELPDFTAARARAGGASWGRHCHRAEPRLMEQAYFDARSFGWSRRPIIELVIPSTLDERSRRADSTSPACSVSTSRRNCRTVRRGTNTATPSPIS